ncbi:MAG: hypothetical protein HY663_00505 [Chloroflexi bacterium]|nr:hypothetical protein [Chloroflexota bacterium]
MILEHKEDISSNFDGTIIDIETVGFFDNQYPDSRRYKDIQLVIFGFTDKDALHILYATGMRSLPELRERTEQIIEGLEKPFYAYNTDFERSVLFYELGREIDFGGELQEGRESKKEACRYLGIPNYDDPFYDNGYLCMKAWENGEFERAIAHNRACLLKERDILLRRGFRHPDGLRLVK